jgi:hypothetical protein
MRSFFLFVFVFSKGVEWSVGEVEKNGCDIASNVRGVTFVGDEGRNETFHHLTLQSNCLGVTVWLMGCNFDELENDTSTTLRQQSTYFVPQFSEQQREM